MKRIVIVVFLCMSAVFLSTGDAQSYTLKQGTISLSGSSNIMFQYTSDNRYYNYSLSVQPGYFVRDNLELAVQLSGYYDSYSDAAYTITPLVIFHIPLGEPSNLFAGAGGGYSWRQYSWNGINLAALLGWEYFLGSQVALHIKAQYNYISGESSSYYHDRYAEVISQLGVSVYF